MVEGETMCNASPSFLAACRTNQVFLLDISSEE